MPRKITKNPSEDAAQIRATLDKVNAMLQEGGSTKKIEKKLRLPIGSSANATDDLDHAKFIASLVETPEELSTAGPRPIERPIFDSANLLKKGI